MIELSKELGPDDFILGNLDAAGYFRVNYDIENWNNIIRQLETNKDEIAKKVRAQLISDSFSLAQAREVSADLPLRLSSYLTKEFDFLPWNVFISRSKLFTDLLDQTRFGDIINNHFAQITLPYFKKFDTWSGNEGETWLDRYLKINHK